MKLLYLDTNIFLNVLLGEEEFLSSSLSLLQDIEDKKFRGITSLLTLMEIHRVLQKQGKTESEVDKAIQDISGSVIEIIIPGESDL